MDSHHRWMLLGLVLCLIVAATFTSSPGDAGLLGIFFALLMVGCCVLPMLFLVFGRGKDGGHSCHGGAGKDNVKRDQGTRLGQNEDSGKKE
jgi:hypothetical protein